MPLILALDTTGEYGSLALLRDAEIVEQVALHSPEGYSQILYGALRDLFARHGIEPADVDCFAAASGPGSFTGVRVGLAAVKGFAEALGKPAVGVSNLEALARCGTAPLRAAVIDARRDQVYAAVYNDQARIVRPEVVTGWQSWFNSLPPEVEEFISAMPLPVPSLIQPPKALAAVVARAAWDRLREGQAPDPASLDANYVRRADAELFWKE